MYWYYGRSVIFFFELRTYTVVLQEMCLNSDHYSEVILYIPLHDTKAESYVSRLAVCFTCVC